MAQPQDAARVGLASVYHDEPPRIPGVPSVGTGSCLRSAPTNGLGGDWPLTPLLCWVSATPIRRVLLRSTQSVGASGATSPSWPRLKAMTDTRWCNRITCTRVNAIEAGAHTKTGHPKLARSFAATAEHRCMPVEVLSRIMSKRIAKPGRPSGRRPGIQQGGAGRPEISQVSLITQLARYNSLQGKTACYLSKPRGIIAQGARGRPPGHGGLSTPRVPRSGQVRVQASDNGARNLTPRATWHAWPSPGHAQNLAALRTGTSRALRSV